MELESGVMRACARVSVCGCTCGYTCEWIGLRLCLCLRLGLSIWHCPLPLPRLTNCFRMGAGISMSTHDGARAGTPT
eukprot:4191294-Pleurochrysis_carterae.AAC.2